MKSVSDVLSRVLGGVAMLVTAVAYVAGTVQIF
jgi:hypothetical protein